MDSGTVLPGSARSDDVAAGPTVEETWLLGQPPLTDYLDFVRTLAVGCQASPKELCDEWRRANDYYGELEQAEAGIADRVECRPLDPAMAPLAEAVMATPHVGRSFDLMPISFGLVELDRLVVHQPRVTATFVEDLVLRLGPSPASEDLFRFCLPTRQEIDVRTSQLGKRRYAFSSESTDLRFHEPVLLRPGQIGGYTGFGPVGGVLGLVVGFGSNLLSAVRADDRLMLLNGYHRACALRTLGVTHAPCIIQTVTRRDELAAIAPQRVSDAPAFYFKSARPPLLKDFFDPGIRKTLKIRRTRKVVEISFELREFDVAE